MQVAGPHDFSLVQERSASHANIQLGHGLICLTEIRGRGLQPADAKAVETHGHVAVSMKGSLHYHRDTKDIDIPANKPGAPGEEILFMDADKLLIIPPERKRTIRLTVYTTTTTTAAADESADNTEKVHGYVDVDISKMGDGEEKAAWFTIKRDKMQRKWQKEKRSKSEKGDLNLGGVMNSAMDGLAGAMSQSSPTSAAAPLGELFVEFEFADKDSAEAKLDLWLAARAAKSVEKAKAAGKGHEMETESWDFRTNSIERKDAWCQLLHWCKSTSHDVGVAHNLPPAHLRKLPSPMLRPPDAHRVIKNPAMIDVPFKRARELIFNLARFKLLDMHRLVNSKDNMLYTLFQLEAYAWKKPKDDEFYHTQAKHQDNGVAVGTYKGLDFKLTLERLSMVRHGKSKSMTYSDLINESQTERGMVALRVLQTMIGAWAFLRRGRYAAGTLLVVDPNAKEKDLRCALLASATPVFACGCLECFGTTNHICMMPPALFFLTCAAGFRVPIGFTEKRRRGAKRSLESTFERPNRLTYIGYQVACG
eukprot:SAG11_NODE_694_length_7695_cov_2.772775_5_plen_536_part_00